MQLLEERDFIEDPYKNTLLDDPRLYNSYYCKESNGDFIGSLKIECSKQELEIVKNHYFKGEYKEEIVTVYYTLKRGNDNGLFWHEILGDSRVIDGGILITEIIYSDSMESRVAGYFVSSALDLTLKPYGFVSVLNIEEILTYYEKIKISNYDKLCILLDLKPMNYEEKTINEWLNEPISEYLEDIKGLLIEKE